MIFFYIFFLCILLIGIAATIFWIVMIVNVAQRKFRNENDKILWILVIVLGGFLGAIIYYFMVVKKTSNVIPQSIADTDKEVKPS